MKVHFGMMASRTPIRRDELAKFQEIMRMADAYGVAAIGNGDTSFTNMDAFVRTTLIATATERALVGLRPTNPVTRGPQIMASFLASLDALTNGRAFIDMASGDSAVLNAGLKPASRAEIEEYVACVRDLLAKGEGTYHGKQQRIRWVDLMVRRRVPVSICAEGPKMLHLGGRIGDGVIAGTGLLPEVIQDAISRVRAGALEAGRDPSQVDIWFTCRSALDDDREKALERAKGSLSSMLNHSNRFGLEGKMVPPEVEKPLRAFLDGYDLYDHARGRNVRLMDELGLTGYALKRYGLVGNAKDWVGRIEQLADAGATRLWVTIMIGYDDLDSQLHYMRVFGEQIAPHFR